MTKEKLGEYLLAFLVSAASFLYPLLVPVLLIITFDLLDLWVGVRAARKRGEQFTLSRAYQRTLDKITAQGATIIIAFIFETFLLKGQPVITIAEGAIIMVQLRSIREKVKELTGFDLIGSLPKLNKRK